jgi:hypothetical protein
MVLFTVTINKLSPALDKKFQKRPRIGTFLERRRKPFKTLKADRTTGNILADGGAVAGTWS